MCMICIHGFYSPLFCFMSRVVRYFRRYRSYFDRTIKFPTLLVLVHKLILTFKEGLLKQLTITSFFGCRKSEHQTRKNLKVLSKSWTLTDSFPPSTKEKFIDGPIVSVRHLVCTDKERKDFTKLRVLYSVPEGGPPSFTFIPTHLTKKSLRY